MFDATSKKLSTNPLTSREDLVRATLDLLEPLIPYTSVGGARVRIGATKAHFDQTAADLEGFARPLWALTSLFLGGHSHSTFQQLLLNGFANGTDPSHPEYWRELQTWDQRLVEMAPIAFSILYAPEFFWEPLTSKQQDNFAKWLGKANHPDMVFSDNNWRWFRIYVNLALRSVGSELFSKDILEKDLQRIDEFYVGNGWYRDGDREQFDYYNSYAFHIFSLIYSQREKDVDPERCEKYRQQAVEFAAGFVHYFDPEGRQIPFGRSMTYRFASLSFWAAVVFVDLELPEPLNIGVVKGIILRSLRWWFKQPIFTIDGLLTLGFAYPNLHMTENYNSPQSPYLACQSLLPLALPESHPFWTSSELPYPSEFLGKVTALKEPRHIISSYAGHKFLLSSGQHCGFPIKATAAKYGKFAYSALFGFSVPTGSFGIDQNALDNVLALSDDGGDVWKVPRVVQDAQLVSIAVPRVNWEMERLPALMSTWKPWPNVEVETWLIAPSSDSPEWHVRIHQITTKRRLSSVQGGFAIPVSSEQGRRMKAFDGETGAVKSSKESMIALGSYASGIRQLDESRNDTAITAKIIPSDPNSNLVSPKTAFPVITQDFEANDKDCYWVITGVFAASKEGNSRSVSEAWARSPMLPYKKDFMHDYTVI